MPIGFRAATGITATADTTTPFANITWTMIAGEQAGDLLLAFYGGKPFNTVPSDPSTYTPLSGIANGTTANGAGSGSVYAKAWYKQALSTAEANPTSTMAAQYSPAMAAMIGLTKDGDTWTVQSTTGIDAASAGTSYSVTGAATLPYTTGDWIIASAVHNDDSSSNSSPAITIPGCTVGTVTQRLTGTLTTATGNDGRMYVYTAPITAGTATGAPTLTATTGNADSDGTTVFILARENFLPKEYWGIMNL